MLRGKGSETKRSKSRKGFDDIVHRIMKVIRRRFGLGGGMQARTFYINVRNAGFDMTLEEVAQMIEDWYSFYPEVKQMLDLRLDGYVPASTFDKTKSNTEEEDDDLVEEEEIEYADNGPRELLRDVNGEILDDPDRMVKLFKTVNALGMVKARGTKCAVANFNFQSYAAAANKIAMWWVFYSEWERAKREKNAVRFKIVNFIHERKVAKILNNNR